jgi:hypothetical protein
MILKIIGQYRQTHYDIIDKTITLILKVSTYIINCVAFRPIGHTMILAILSVSTFITDDILYIYVIVNITNFLNVCSIPVLYIIFLPSCDQILWNLE